MMVFFMLEKVYEDHARLIAALVADFLREGHVVVPEYVNPDEAARLTGVPKRTLENFRLRNSDEGPSFTRRGRLIRYKVSDLRAWMEAHRVQRSGGEK